MQLICFLTVNVNHRHNALYWMGKRTDVFRGNQCFTNDCFGCFVTNVHRRLFLEISFSTMIVLIIMVAIINRKSILGINFLKVIVSFTLITVLSHRSGYINPISTKSTNL